MHRALEGFWQSIRFEKLDRLQVCSISCLMVPIYAHHSKTGNTLACARVRIMLDDGFPKAMLGEM
jgi:hypothetical protein